MSYISLYRKYRPQKFREIVGQPHVVAALLGALAQDKISHAYLFAGPRGTGKTSVARILVRAINCQNPQDKEPCGECPACLALLEGKSLDILEIDAASNRGIEEIRSLREKVQFAATKVLYKAFIIDEVHMLTKEAFNALLKTLEEPPKNTVFILCTTEVHKLPETIVSRCQRFDFRRISEGEIIEHLKKVLAKEKIDFEEAAVKIIAKSAHGGLRDALSLADQLASVGGKLTLERTLGFLGCIDEETIFEILTWLANNEKGKIFEEFDRLKEKGVNWPSFSNQLILAMRKVLLAQFVKTKEENQIYLELAQKKGVNFWSQAIEAFLTAEVELKYSPIPELCLEMAVMKALKEQKMEDGG
jgi:DNA polymerase-3 subunit gamma/tau